MCCICNLPYHRQSHCKDDGNAQTLAEPYSISCTLLGLPPMASGKSCQHDALLCLQYLLFCSLQLSYQYPTRELLWSNPLDCGGHLQGQECMGGFLVGCFTNVQCTFSFSYCPTQLTLWHHKMRCCKVCYWVAALLYGNQNLVSNLQITNSQ